MKYEAHITVEPDGEHTYKEFVASVTELGWKCSTFGHDDVDNIAGKWFMSFASDDRNLLIAETRGMVHSLESAGSTVLRWKIEQTVADSKAGDHIDGDWTWA